VASASAGGAVGGEGGEDGAGAAMSGHGHSLR
jgi:hypothetical protein